MKIGVLASHEGTTLQAIIDACATGALRASVAAVICNNRDAGALRRAREAGIRAYHLSSQTHGDPSALDSAIRDVLVSADADIVVLAGYMKRLGAQTLSRFRGRVLNTHPALLPKFGGQGMYGTNVHRAVLAAGETTTGASVHLVTEDYDAGPVIAQCIVPVLPTDTAETLAQRVQARERAFIVEVLAAIAGGRLQLPSAVNADG
jgi:phosphoribosylglycinamide formyltransferase-1